MNHLEWSYFAEGGANIIFQYIGEDPKYKNKVIRARKMKMDEDEVQKTISLLPTYHDRLCVYLEAFSSVGSLNLLHVSKKFSRSLFSSSFAHRPDFRRNQSERKAFCETLIIMKNLLNRKFSCEIKPKWSGSKHLSIQTGICKCRFCTAQFIKGRRDIKDDHNLSDRYCPALLFSKNAEHVALALTDIMTNSSNQFKLCIDGDRIEHYDLRQYTEKLVPVLTQIISNDPLFQNFLRIQIDLLNDIRIEALENFIPCFEDYLKDLSFFISKKIDDMHEIPEYIRIFLAMSIRDASFIISFQNNYEIDLKMIQLNNRTIFYRVDIVDLDIKSVKKFYYYLSEIKAFG